MMSGPRRPHAAFTEFCKNLGVELEPGQRALCKVAFDGLEPRDLVGEERELARLIFGPDVDVVPAGARDVFAAVCGRASGKTKLSSLRLLHLALTVPLSMLGRGQVALVPIVAPKLKLATECFSMVKGEVLAHPKLAAMLKNPESSESILLERPDGKRVSIEPIAATAGGGAVRGRNIPAALLEECAFFRDDNFKVNDAEIFSAVVPRLLPGGQVLLVSSPWVRSGLLYSLHRDNWGQPATALVAHAPTLTMRDRPDVLAMAERERRRDPDNFRTEFEAQFLDASATQFFDEATLDRCLAEPVALGSTPQPGDVVTHGGDFGFVHDSSTLATVHWRAGVALVADLFEARPEPGSPLKPSRVCADFAKRARAHGGDCVMADSHYREAVREHLEVEGLYLLGAPEGQGGKASSYVKARSLMREGRVRLPKDDRLLRQLREVTAKPVPGGGLSVSSPRGPGGHGDLVSALVLALWQEHGAEVAAPRLEVGSEAYEVERERRSVERLEERQRRREAAPWWGEGNDPQEGTAWLDSM
jgi:hypothetical protein